MCIYNLQYNYINSIFFFDFNTNLIEFSVVAKLAHPKPAEAGLDDPKGEKKKKPPAENKAAILQSLRTKMNNLLQEDGKFLHDLFS